MNSYFSHDSNARNDEKILALRLTHGWQGYGLYWAIIEKLRDATDYMLKTDYDVIAYDLQVQPEIIKSIINDFGLFEKKGDNPETFCSLSLLKRMEKKDAKSKKARESATARWSKPAPTAEQLQSDSNADVMRTHSDSNPSAMLSKVKESKVNKSKGKESKAHTHSDDIELKNKTRARELLTWIETTYPKFQQMEQPFTEDNLLWIARTVEDEDIKRIIGDMSNKKKYENNDAYSTFTNFARKDFILKDKQAGVKVKYYTYAQTCDMATSGQCKQTDFIPAVIDGITLYALKSDVAINQHGKKNIPLPNNTTAQ